MGWIQNSFRILLIFGLCEEGKQDKQDTSPFRCQTNGKGLVMFLSWQINQLNQWICWSLLCGKWEWWRDAFLLFIASAGITYSLLAFCGPVCEVPLKQNDRTALTKHCIWLTSLSSRSLWLLQPWRHYYHLNFWGLKTIFTTFDIYNLVLP